MELFIYNPLLPVADKYYLIALAIGLLLLLALMWRPCKKYRGSRLHVKYVHQAERVYKDLRDTGYSNAQKLTFLRKINPYVFEELVLIAFNRKGISIKRNARYSGDGGVDGVVVVEGKECLVQCKRYRSYINVRHVEEFAELCRQHGARGFFIHTGRTGPGSHEVLSDYHNIEFISGEKLIKLIIGN